MPPGELQKPGPQNGEMKSEDALIEVARIVKPLGIRGELKVLPLTRTPSELGRYKFFYIADESGRVTEVVVDCFQVRSNAVILKLVGLDARDQAEKYRDCALLIRQDQLPRPEEGEYFIQDLIGLSVVSDDGEELGTLRDVLELSAHDIYQVENGDRELLIPAISDFILDIDLKRRKMIVRLPEGLRDL